MRSILFLVLFSFASSSVYALENSIALGGGLLLNYNDHNEDLGEHFDDDVSLGFNLGARAIFKLSDYMGLRTGLFYQDKSASFSYDDGSADGNLNARIVSASLPVNLQFQLNDNFQIFGGYVADFTLNDYCTTSGDLNSCWLDGDLKSVIHHATLGLTIRGNDKLDIDLSYQHALSDTYDKFKIHSLIAQFFIKL